MKKSNLETLCEIMLEHMDAEEIKAQRLRMKEERKRRGAVWEFATPSEIAEELCQGGCFAVYYDDVEEEMRRIYGADYDGARYRRKDGGWKQRNGEAYIWGIYKRMIARGIEKLARDGLII